MTTERMPNGYRKPLAPLTYKRVDGWRSHFDGTKTPQVRFHIYDANGHAVASVKSQQEVDRYIREATS
jgi:hypothetical protein